MHYLHWLSIQSFKKIFHSQPLKLHFSSFIGFVFSFFSFSWCNFFIFFFVTISYCSDKLPHTILQKYRACVLPQDCQVSVWSAMRPHNTSCIGYDGQIIHGFMIRTRQVRAVTEKELLIDNYWSHNGMLLSIFFFNSL